MQPNAATVNATQRSPYNNARVAVVPQSLAAGRLLIGSVVLSTTMNCAAALAEFVPLLNGADLTGWQVVGGDAEFSVENSEIVGRSMPDEPNSFLVTNQQYTDFVLELEFQIFDPAFNSGVQLRSQSLATHNGGRLFGYQVEIDPTTRAWSGGVYFEGGSPDRPAGWLDELSDNPQAQQAFMLGEWNHFRIVAQGRRITTWINEVPAADYFDFDSDALLTTGVVGLQVHSNPSATPLEVRWRNLFIDELPPGANLILGDLDGSSAVDFGDYQIIVANLHRDVSDLSEAEAYLSGDLTGDGAIDYQDFLAIRKAYPPLSTSSAVIEVPEPCAMVMLVLGSGLLLGRAARRTPMAA